MAEPREVAASRKEILRARCAMQRLTLALQARSLRESLTIGRALHSTPARSVLAAALLLFASRRKVGRLAGWISGALALVRLARSIGAFAGRKAP